jgi:hypothetical protein
LSRGNLEKRLSAKGKAMAIPMKISTETNRRKDYPKKLLVELKDEAETHDVTMVAGI